MLGGPSILLNLILVDSEVRPAMLLQPANFNEWLSTDPLTSECMFYIKQQFPHLKYSDNYSPFQGIIISKYDDYNGTSNISSVEMGKILGYPCYKEFGEILEAQTDPENKEVYSTNTIDLAVILQNPNAPHIILFSNRCIGYDKISQFKDIAYRAMRTFNSHKYDALLTDIHIRTVDAVTTSRITSQSTLNKLLARSLLTEGDMECIIGDMWNLNDPTRISETIIDTLYEPNNDIHNGLLMIIMLDCIPKCDRISPIYGTNSPELIQYTNIREKWFYMLLEIFKRTRKNTPITTSIFSRLLRCGCGPKLIEGSNDSKHGIMNNIFNARRLSSTEKREIHTSLLRISSRKQSLIVSILEMYEFSNKIHIGIMLGLLLGISPQYDCTAPFKEMNSLKHEYILHRQFSEVWLDNVHHLFEGTTDAL
jgi:hypothetical protein